jgi:hypothetical protein
MINQHSLQQITQVSFGDPFKKPLFGSYCFNSIHGTIVNAFGKATSRRRFPKEAMPAEYPQKSSNKRYKNVVLFLLDAFGWRSFEELNNRNVPLIARCADENEKSCVVSQITSMFPSTTAAHISTLHSGMQIAEHGMYEWFCYEPVCDGVIAPLLFSYMKDSRRESLLEYGIVPESFLPQTTFYQELKTHGIYSYTFQSDKLSETTYSKTLLKGSDIHGFASFETGVKSLSNLFFKLDKEDEHQKYFMIYHDAFDMISHKKGAKALDAVYTGKYIFEVIDECFVSKFGKKEQKIRLYSFLQIMVMQIFLRKR